jgi:hypothetical protein
MVASGRARRAGARCETDVVRRRLPHQAVVIRGGLCKPDDLAVSARFHWARSGKREWALSVFAHKSRDADWIARRARRSDEEALLHPVIRETTAGRIRAAGYEVVLRGRRPRGHALILLPNPPRDAEWPVLSSLFDEPRDNPAL